MIKFFFDGKRGRALMYEHSDFPEAVMFETEGDNRLTASFSGRIRAHAESLRNMIFPECWHPNCRWRLLSHYGPDLTIIREIISAINHCKSEQIAPKVDELTEKSRPIWQLSASTDPSFQELIPTPLTFLDIN